MMDLPDNITKTVTLVERNVVPQGMVLVDPERMAKANHRDLIALAMEIQKADNYIKANACNKLQVIAEQMKFLQKQAEKVLLEAEQNTKFHHAACNFIKQPGCIYHLYERQCGQYYFSMLSPEEWGDCGPVQTFKGSFRLEQDQSWTPLVDVDSKDNELFLVNKFISTGNPLRAVSTDMSFNVK